jgi:hypothetical protein
MGLFTSHPRMGYPLRRKNISWIVHPRMGNIISIPGWDIPYQEKIFPFIDETSPHGMGSMGCHKGD